MPETPYAWLGSVSDFLQLPEAELLSNLTRFARETGTPQLFAWDRSLAALRRELGGCMPDAADFALVLEFELPRSGGRRPDLILLENGTVLVIEFKNRVCAEPADVEQVLGYVRDLSEYHLGSRDRELVPFLVPVGMTAPGQEQRGVRIVPPAELGAAIRELAGPSRRRQRPDAQAWAGARYEPLPALVEAARLLFERNPLPRVRRAEAARIPETVDLIETQAHGRGRKLVLLSGVPGSGKTLVGLQLVHSRNLGAPAVFLSGNGPLVSVLQHALGSRLFVQDLHSFLKEHWVRHPGPPRERVIVFDEAQRAWDRDRVLQKHQGRLADSEPGLLVKLCDLTKDDCALVALLGEGQEIHAGEESGIGIWVSAITNSSAAWEIIGPPHLAGPFQEAGLDYKKAELLNLTSSLRSHRASQVASWAESCLEGRLGEAAKIAAGLWKDGFALWASRSLEACRQYLRDRYAGEPSKRFGMLASSKYRKLEERFGIASAGHRYYWYGEWYNESAAHPRSCCRLDQAVSEFGCQGLELDMPLLCWGPDLIWNTAVGGWEAKVGKPRLVRDPRRLRSNAYRVLLTRGRDGLLTFVPPDQETTWTALLSAGFRDLALG